MDAITLDKNPALNKVCHQKDSIISHNLCVRRTLFGTLLYSAFYRPHVGEVTCPALIENSPRLHSVLQPGISGWSFSRLWTRLD